MGCELCDDGMMMMMMMIVVVIMGGFTREGFFGRKWPYGMVWYSMVKECSTG